MLTVVETPLFQRQWPLYWSEEERAEFAVFLAAEPEAGVVGCRTDNLTGPVLKEIRRALEP